MSENRPLGLVIPTRWEAQAALRKYPFKLVGRGLFRGVINGRSVLACVSGVGPVQAARAADRLVASGAKELVSMGFCGALVPELHVGDLVTDRIATVSKPARTPAERRAVMTRANAVAVDMETQAIVEAGTRQGVPIHILRVISDEYQDDLSPLFGDSGSFDWWRIALNLAKPSVWPLARKLRKQSRLAGARLADALGAFCKNTAG